MMNFPKTLLRKQNGAVAVVFGLAAIAVFAVGGVVLDLGHLYIAKAELQNAADAAALAGAKDLNQTSAGIDAALLKAQAISRSNNFNFSSAVVLPSASVSFGPSPDGPWSTLDIAKQFPQGKTFIRVDTGQKTLNTYLMRVAGINTVATSGVAVAGRFVNDITPIGVCAADPANKTAKYVYPSGLSEIVEFGFRRGVTYNLFGLNPLGGANSDPYLINPVDVPPATCGSGAGSHTSDNFTAPFMCTGGSAILSSGKGKVLTNPGLSANLALSLNSRFEDYPPAGKCDPTSAPPDTNIQEYPCKGTADPACVDNPTNIVATTPPINWMEPNASNLPTREFVAINASQKPKYQLPSATNLVPNGGATPTQFSEYGVLWSYGPAYQADTSTPPKAGTPITPQQANQNPLYSPAAPVAPAGYFDTSTSANYPTSPGAGFPASTPASPYNQTSPPYFKAPTRYAGVRNRRILNVVLVDCRTPPTGPASCAAMDAVGIGRFFMPVRANASGGPSNRRLDVEFVGLIEPVPSSEIKLYR